MLYYFICRLIKEHSPYTLNDVINAPLTVKRKSSSKHTIDYDIYVQKKTFK